jgi:hypothetical protein
MDSPQQSQSFKRCEVSPDRLRGYFQLVCKLLNFYTAMAAGSAQDFLVAF